MVAVIGDGGHVASITLHERAGFRQVGTFRSVGFKLGRWVDTVLMQRPLGPGDEMPPVERAARRRETARAGAIVTGRPEKNHGEAK